MWRIFFGVLQWLASVVDCRRRPPAAAQLTAAPSPQLPTIAMQLEASSADDAAHETDSFARARNRWVALLDLIIARKRWSEWGRARKNAKKMPLDLDGKARGFGKHVGRWGWREIRSSW